MLNEVNLTRCYLWINKQSASLAVLPELILLKCGSNCRQEAAGGSLQSLSSVLGRWESCSLVLFSPSAPVLGRWESLACMSSGLHTFSLLDLLLLVLTQPSAQCQMKTRKSVPCPVPLSNATVLGSVSVPQLPVLIFFFLFSPSRAWVGAHTGDARDIISTQGEAAQPACFSGTAL